METPKKEERTPKTDKNLINGESTPKMENSKKGTET